MESIHQYARLRHVCDDRKDLKVQPLILLQIVLNKVLLVGTRTSAYIGKPVVTNATVHAVVEEQVGFMTV